MSRRHLCVGLILFAALGFRGSAFGKEPKPPTLENHRELARLLNIVKKSPQAEYRAEAREKLKSQGVPLLDVVFVLTLDQWLLKSDPIVRYRASAELSQMPSPVRVLAITNLRNLIAAEVDPYLIWMHAVTLSSIDPNSGSAFEIINATPHNAILRRTLHLDGSRPWPVTRSINEAVISETTLSKDAYQELSQRLRLRHLGNPADAPAIGTYTSPAPTKVEDPPPPPPQKIPAHPLIAGRQFGEIFRQMDQGSMEAWELFRWYGEDFPPALVAKRYVPLAFNKAQPVRDRAMFVLTHSGPDAEIAAALITAISRNFGILDQSELIYRIKTPGPFSQEVLKRIRYHKNPSVRYAVFEALVRAPEMDQLLLETLQVSLSDDDLDIRHAAISAISKSRNPNARTEAWLKDLLLKETQPEVLAAAATALKGQPLPADFQRQVFQRIDAEKPADFNLVLIDCLLDQADTESPAGKQLLQFKDGMQALYIMQTEAYLVRELRWMIGESQSINHQTQLDILEQLEKLKVLD